MNISSINLTTNPIYNKETKKQKTQVLPDLPADNKDIGKMLRAMTLVNPSFKMIITEANRAAANNLTEKILNGTLRAESFTVASNSAQQVFTEVIYATIENLKQRCSSLDYYRNALSRLLDGLNRALDSDFDVYDCTRIVGNAINNAYNDYRMRGNSFNRGVNTSPAGDSLTSEQRDQIRHIVSEFMRLKDSFRIWNYVRIDTDVKRVLRNFIPELRKQCATLEQYKYMTSLYADSVGSLYRAIQHNDLDGSFHDILLETIEARDSAESYYNSTILSVPQQQAETVLNAKPAEASATQAPKSKLAISNIEEVNTYLIAIAKRYANGINVRPERGPALTFSPPIENKDNENYYLNSSDDATTIFGRVVLNTTFSEGVCRDTSKDSTLLKLIQRRDFDPNHRYDSGYNISCRPIFILTTLNKPYLLQEALKLRSADPNLINGGSLTALSRAVSTNSLDCTYVLLKSGKVDTSDIERCKRDFTLTPEMKGLLNSYPNMDEYINSTIKSLQELEKINIKSLDDVLRTPNIDVNFVDSNGNNVLHVACKLEDKQEALRVASNALGCKVNINSANNKKETPLEIALKNRNFELVGFLIEHGADLSVINDEVGYSFVHTAISVASEDDALRLLDIAKSKGASLDSQSCSGVTPFIQAVKLKKYKIIQYLLTNGILANKADNYGRVPLHYACMLNDGKSLEMLLNNFVSTRIKDNLGKYAIDYLTKPELINFYKMFDGMV